VRVCNRKNRDRESLFSRIQQHTVSVAREKRGRGDQRKSSHRNWLNIILKVCFFVGGIGARRVSGVVMVLSGADEWALGLWQGYGKVNKIFF